MLNDTQMRLIASTTVKSIGHAAALLFCAWWLIATSAPYEGPSDCFDGTRDSTRVRIVLEAPTLSEPTRFQSCGGLDGLAAGETLTLSLERASSDRSSASACFRFDTTAAEGAKDVAISPNASLGDPEALTVARGAFSSTREPGCKGHWTLIVRRPTQHAGTPADAGSTERWIVERTIVVREAERCGDALDGVGEVPCEDRFEVESITEVTP